jgi:exportin-1
MEALLNFDKELDIALLDRIVQTFFTGSGAEVWRILRGKHADQVSNGKRRQYCLNSKTIQMLGPRSMPFWRAAQILSQSVSLQRWRFNLTQVIALSILDKLITTRWKVLPKEQAQGIRNYIVSVMIKTSSDEALMNKEKTYLNKLNLTLVAVRQQPCSMRADIRYSSKTGPRIGLLLFPKLFKRAKPICHFAKTIW